MPSASTCWDIDLKYVVERIALFDLLSAFPMASLWIYQQLYYLMELYRWQIDENLSDDSILREEKLLRVEKYVSSLVLMLHILWIGFEIYLFKLLRTGAAKKDYTSCFRWFNFRVVFVIIGSFTTIYEIVMHHYSVIDAVYEIKAVYRLFSMVVVRCFMNQIEKETEQARKLYGFPLRLIAIS